MFAYILFLHYKCLSYLHTTVLSSGYEKSAFQRAVQDIRNIYINK